MQCFFYYTIFNNKLEKNTVPFLTDYCIPDQQMNKLSTSVAFILTFPEDLGHLKKILKILVPNTYAVVCEGFCSFKT